MRTLATLLLASGLLTVNVAEAGGFKGHATLQVRSEPGYQAQDIARLLADAAYLGSVQPGLIPVGNMGNQSEYPREAAFLDARNPGGEILTLEIIGFDEATTAAYLKALIDNLSKIVPSGRASAMQQKKAAEDQLRDARDRHSAAKADLRKFVATHGALEPSTWLNQMRNQIMSHASELQSTDFRLAGDRALRDYLVETIAQQPPEIAKKLPEDDAVVSNLRQLVKVARGELKMLSSRYDSSHPEIKKAKQKLEELELALDQRLAVTLVEKNNARIQLERELFSLEKELALAENRRLYLAGLVTELREEAKKLALMESEWSELNSEFAMADRELAQATQQMNDANRYAHQAFAGEWIQVIAGPQVSEE